MDDQGPSARRVLLSRNMVSICLGHSQAVRSKVERAAGYFRTGRCSDVVRFIPDGMVSSRNSSRSLPRNVPPATTFTLGTNGGAVWADVDSEVTLTRRRFFPAIGESINHLNDQWSYTLEKLDLEDQSLWKMTRRVMRIPTPLPPRGYTRGTCSLRLQESQIPCRQSGGSVSAGKRPVGNGRH